MRQPILISTIVTLLLCVLAAFGEAERAASKALYQTIPGALGVYLPIVIRQELPTPTPTATATVTLTPIATPTLTATPVPTVTPTPTSGPQCHASYPTVCIPPPPPDLNCKDISYRRFKVLPPDPHNFDSDHDGIGCET